MFLNAASGKLLFPEKPPFPSPFGKPNMTTDTMTRPNLSDDLQAECWKNFFIYPDGSTAWGGHSFATAQNALEHLRATDDPTAEYWENAASGREYLKSRTAIIQRPVRPSPSRVP